MSVAAHLNLFYSGTPIFLWVEDTVTRDYLTTAWGSPAEVVCLLAGGRADVRPLIESARREGINRVFGLVDRDFGTSNYSDWNRPDVYVFRLRRHEIENYLLDVPALTNCPLNSRGMADVQVQAEMLRIAGLQPWWMACRRVMSELRIAVTDGFPKQPAIMHVNSLIDAEAHIRNSTWFGNVAGITAHWTSGTALTNAIEAAHNDMQTYLANGNWLTEFSGSEIFRPLRDYVYSAPGNSSPDNDLAKVIGAWQEQNSAVPQDIRDLRSSLRQRVGLPP